MAGARRYFNKHPAVRFWFVHMNLFTQWMSVTAWIILHIREVLGRQKAPDRWILDAEVRIMTRSPLPNTGRDIVGFLHNLLHTRTRTQNYFIFFPSAIPQSCSEWEMILNTQCETYIRRCPEALCSLWIMHHWILHCSKRTFYLKYKTGDMEHNCEMEL